LLRPRLTIHQMERSALETTAINDIIGKRGGRVLGKDTLLKADMYVPIQWTSQNNTADSQPMAQIAGAPNFRRVVIPGTTISLYGVGQPTQYGIRALLTLIKGTSPIDKSHRSNV